MTQENKHEGEGSEKSFNIIMNGDQRAVAVKELTYDEVVNLAYNNNPPTGPNISFAVTYRRGEGNKPEGNMDKGDTVKIKEGMIFNVTPTDKS